MRTDAEIIGVIRYSTLDMESILAYWAAIHATCMDQSFGQKSDG